MVPGVDFSPRCLGQRDFPLLAHGCPGRVPRHVRSWRKPTPHSGRIRWSTPRIGAHGPLEPLLLVRGVSGASGAEKPASEPLCGVRSALFDRPEPPPVAPTGRKLPRRRTVRDMPDRAGAISIWELPASAADPIVQNQRG